MDAAAAFCYLPTSMLRPFHFIGLWLAAALCAGATPPKWATFTIATANLSDNETQTYGAAGIRILQALQPDVLAIQEYNYKLGTSKDLAQRLFGPDAHFAREKGGSRLPNGVMSRYPIVAFGQWEDPYVGNRCFFWATVQIPGPKPLHVVSVHLVQNHSERRLPEARHLLELIRQQFPEGDYVALCGDFNVATRDSEALAALTNWFDDSAHPADQAGNKNTNANRNRPYDYVLPNPALAPYHAPTVLLDQKFPAGLVFDSRLWNPLPPPAEWEDTARDLQHLPVLKTFRVPLVE